MTSAASLPACPVCGSALADLRTRCPQCKTDPRLLAGPASIALEFYNEGLHLAKAGDRQAAIEKMRGALAAHDGLVDAYIVLGKLLAQGGAAADLEDAVTCWQRAQDFSATVEQARKLDQCIQTANGRLLDARTQEDAARRGRTNTLFFGAVVLALVCGASGYVLRTTPLFAPGGPFAPGSSWLSTPLGARTGGVPVDPIAAVNEALRRPDITVVRTGDRLALKGVVQTEAERGITMAAAAYAARLPDAAIDGSGLKIKKSFAKVAAKRVEHMLRLVINRLGPASVDPLRAATISVTGGSNGFPLVVAGTCANRGAGPEVARLVKEVYPSAAPVDTSGLIVTARSARQDHGTTLGNSIGPAVDRAEASPPRSHVAAATRRSVASPQGDQVYINLSTKTYTVQPGDTILAITQKYGRDARQWQQLWQTNKTALHRPNAISAGTILKLPPGWKSPKPSGDDNE